MKSIFDLHREIKEKHKNYCKHLVTKIPEVCPEHGVPLSETRYVNGFNEPGSAYVCFHCYPTMDKLSDEEIAAVRKMGYEPIKRQLFEHYGMVQKSNNVECVGGFIDLDPVTLVTLGTFIAD